MKKINWSLMVCNKERYNPIEVAEELHENFNIMTAVAVEGNMFR